MLGPSLLTPSPNPRPLPDLLPFKKGKKLHNEMAEAHPYAFDMGGTWIIKDYKEAGKVLMERNFPDVLHNKQKEVVYIPEAHLPKVPMAVDIPRCESRKKKLDEMVQQEGSAVLEELGMKTKGGAKEMEHARGDLAEKELVEEIKEVVVYQYLLRRLLPVHHPRTI